MAERLQSCAPGKPVLILDSKVLNPIGWVAERNQMLFECHEDTDATDPGISVPGNFDIERIDETASKTRPVGQDGTSNIPSGEEDPDSFDMGTKDGLSPKNAALIHKWETRPPSKHSWEYEFSATYTLHAFNNVNGEYAGFKGITLEYVLRRQSNLAKAVYPAVKHALDTGVLPVEAVGKIWRWKMNGCLGGKRMVPRPPPQAEP